MNPDIGGDAGNGAEFWPGFGSGSTSTPGDFSSYGGNLGPIQGHHSSLSWMPPSNTDGYTATTSSNSAFDLSSLFLAIELSHKPRSLAGASEMITEGFKLRVDKSAGKNIIVTLSCPVPCNWQTLKLRLAPPIGSEADEPEDTFKIDPSGVQASEDGLTAEVMVKLLSHGRSVAIDAAVTSADGTTEIFGRSVTFLTHNSGPPSKKRKLSSSGRSAGGLLSVSPPESTSVSPSAQAGGMSPQHTSPNSDTMEAPPSSDWTNVNSNMQVNGVVRARGYITYSDLRLKTSIEDIVDAMHIVCSLKAHKFEWNPDLIETESGGRKVIGFLAQEVQKVLPEVVQKTDDGWLTVNYVEILPILLEAFKQHVKDTNESSGRLSAEVIELRSEVDKLTQQHTESTAVQLYNAFLGLHQRLKTASLRQKQLRASRPVGSSLRPPPQTRVTRATNAPHPFSSTPIASSSFHLPPARLLPQQTSTTPRLVRESHEDDEGDEDDDEDDGEDDADDISLDSGRGSDNQVEMRPFNQPIRRTRGIRERPVTRAEMQRYFDAVELASTMRRKSTDCAPLVLFYRIVVVLLLIVIIVEISILFTPSPVHELNAYLKRNAIVANMTLTFGLPIGNGTPK